MAQPAPKAVAETAAPAREIPAIRRGVAWKLTESCNNSFRGFVGEAVQLADLENESLWEIVASDLHAYDRVTVIREDRAFWADCLVIDAAPGRARVVVLGSIQPLPPRLSIGENRVPAGFDIKQNEMTGLWLAWRESDGVQMSADGYPSFEMALRGLLDHACFRK